MEGFLNWFFQFMSTMLGGIWDCVKNIFLGLFQIFNFGLYIGLFDRYKSDFNIIGWALAVLAFYKWNRKKEKAKQKKK